MKSFELLSISQLETMKQALNNGIESAISKGSQALRLTEMYWKVEARIIELEFDTDGMWPEDVGM